jgi:eukaryotic-like serine/threonine-protein kinase
MNTDREEEVFDVARDIASTGERAAYLAKACGADAPLRQRIEQMLAADAAAGEFFKTQDAPSPTVIVAEASLSPSIEKAGDRIGRYKLLQQIGEGGMGLVYMAEQDQPVRRSVALKIIKLGMDTREVVARFEAERQALAMMNHPHIAKVFDAGATDSGRPYFVMELVRGIPITEYCDKNCLPTGQRLDLFILVCQAVQHAHQKGIIHRDLKPSNILVTLNDGVPWPMIIDFGIAKATHQRLTEKTLFTHFAQMIGTPAYMSPEQAEMSKLDVDTRSDIYALGVLLYELLTGSTPFPTRELLSLGYREMQRTIAEREPPRLSTRLSTMANEERTVVAKNRSLDGSALAKLFRGDLDWIVMKCLEKDRTRRYDTVNGLAGDVQRYLSNEPVVACPPSAGYRLRKFVRRNKGPVLAAGFVLLTLLVGIVGTTLGLIEAGRQRLVVERQRNELAGRNRALQAAHEHGRLLNERARQAIETVMSETAIEQLTRQKELSPEQKDFLNKMIQYYTEATQEAPATEQERTRQARAYHRMGRFNQILGRDKDSENAYRRAVSLFQQLAADFPTRPEFRMELAMSHNMLGVLLLATGRLTEAESAKIEGLAILKQLAADFPNRPEFRQALAGFHQNLGHLLHVTGRLTEAESAQAEALAIRKQLAAEFPTNPGLNRALGLSYNSLGWLFQDTKRLEKAESAYRDAVAHQKQAVADFPNVPEFRLELAKSTFNLGNVLRDTKRPKEAEATRAEALAIFKQLVAEFPNRSEFRQELAEKEGKKPRSATKAREPQESGAELETTVKKN